MELTTLKAHIQTKKFNPVYILCGEEIGVMNIYINQIAKVQNKQVYRADTFKEVFQKVTKQSIIKQSFVYVIRDDKEVITSEKIQKLISKPIWSDIVIIVFSNMDKRTKFYKQYKDMICEFEPLEERVLIKYIKKEIDLSTENCQRLIQACESSYSRIMLEIDKIKTYVTYTWNQRKERERDGGQYWLNHCFEEMLKAGVIYTPPRDAIFIWSNEVMNRKNPVKIFDLTQECYDSGEATLVMLSVLYKTMKKTLQVQSYKGDNLSKATGLTGWDIKCVTPYKNKYKTNELINAMKLIHKVEKGIKTGQIEDSVAVPYVLVNIL